RHRQHRYPHHGAQDVRSAGLQRNTTGAVRTGTAARRGAACIRSRRRCTFGQHHEAPEEAGRPIRLHPDTIPVAGALMTSRSYPTPEVGDIVWCRFPEHEVLKPGPKPRPAIVLSVMDTTRPVRVR